MPDLPTLQLSVSMPPACLKANRGRTGSRGALMGKIAAVKKYRTLVDLVARDAQGVCWPFGWHRVRIRLSFFFKQHGRRDPDNLISWWKSGFDGLRDSGLLLDDNRITHLPPRIGKAPLPHIVVTVTKLD